MLHKLVKRRITERKNEGVTAIGGEILTAEQLDQVTGGDQYWRATHTRFDRTSNHYRHVTRWSFDPEAPIEPDTPVPEEVQP